MRTRHHLRSLAVCATGIAAVLAGCSSGGGQPSDFCKSVDALDAAVTQINQSSLTKSTISAVEKSLATVDGAVTNLSSSAEPEFADEVAAVETATTDLDGTVAAAVDQPVPANLAAARTSMSELTSAVDTLSQNTSDQLLKGVRQGIGQRTVTKNLFHSSGHSLGVPPAVLTS